MINRLALAAAIGLLFIQQPAYPAPPPGLAPNPELHAWFERQHNVSGAWCCDISDGHILNDEEWRMTGDHYEALILGRWYPIQPDQLRRDMNDPNPTGSAVVWYLVIEMGVTIFCFAPGFGG